MPDTPHFEQHILDEVIDAALSTTASTIDITPHRYQEILEAVLAHPKFPELIAARKNPSAFGEKGVNLRDKIIEDLQGKYPDLPSSILQSAFMFYSKTLRG